MSSKRIPNYALYGHLPRQTLDDQVYLQSIEQSQGEVIGEIKAHQHDALLQLIYLSAGAGDVRIEGSQYRIKAPCVLLIPKRTVHALQFSVEAKGVVISVAQQQIEALLRIAEQDLLTLLLNPLVLSLSEDNHKPWQLLVGMFTKQVVDQSRQAGALGVLLALLSHLQHWVVATDYQPLVRSQTVLASFQELIEGNFRKHWSLELYAQTLGISASKLARICREQTGTAPMLLVQRRVLLEAQRQLAYTETGVKQIAAGLGFNDWSYFSRYFKKHTGISPSEFRRTFYPNR